MLDGMGPEALKLLSIPGVMLGIFLLLIGTGRLRTSKAIQEVRQDRDARILETIDGAGKLATEVKAAAEARVDVIMERLADQKEQTALWREAHRQSELAREIQAEALRTALDVARESEEGWDLFRVWLNTQAGVAPFRVDPPAGKAKDG